jgi:hypothetical protein
MTSGAEHIQRRPAVLVQDIRVSTVSKKNLGQPQATSVYVASEVERCPSIVVACVRVRAVFEEQFRQLGSVHLIVLAVSRLVQMGVVAPKRTERRVEYMTDRRGKARLLHQCLLPHDERISHRFPSLSTQGQAYLISASTTQLVRTDL